MRISQSKPTPSGYRFQRPRALLKGRLAVAAAPSIGGMAHGTSPVRGIMLAEPVSSSGNGNNFGSRLAHRSRCAHEACRCDGKSERGEITPLNATGDYFRFGILMIRQATPSNPAPPLPLAIATASPRVGHPSTSHQHPSADATARPSAAGAAPFAASRSGQARSAQRTAFCGRQATCARAVLCGCVAGARGMAMLGGRCARSPNFPRPALSNLRPGTIRRAIPPDGNC